MADECPNCGEMKLIFIDSNSILDDWECSGCKTNFKFKTNMRYNLKVKN